MAETSRERLLARRGDALFGAALECQAQVVPKTREQLLRSVRCRIVRDSGNDAVERAEYDRWNLLHSRRTAACRPQLGAQRRGGARALAHPCSELPPVTETNEHAENEEIQNKAVGVVARPEAKLRSEQRADDGDVADSDDRHASEIGQRARNQPRARERKLGRGKKDDGPDHRPKQRRGHVVFRERREGVLPKAVADPQIGVALQGPEQSAHDPDRERPHRPSWDRRPCVIERMRRVRLEWSIGRLIEWCRWCVRQSGIGDAAERHRQFSDRTAALSIAQSQLIAGAIECPQALSNVREADAVAGAAPRVAQAYTV